MKTVQTITLLILLSIPVLQVQTMDFEPPPASKVESKVAIEKWRLVVGREMDAISLFRRAELARNTCDLSVMGYEPPSEFKRRVEAFDCHTKQLLSTLAYFESTWREDVCDYKWGHYCGLYQIGAAARTECINNGRNDNDEDCALYHFEVNAYGRYESVQRHYSSFEKFI